MKFFSKLKIGLVVMAIVLLPSVVSAQANLGTNVAQVGSLSCMDYYKADATLGGMFTYITCTINKTVIPLIFAIAMVTFIWGVVQFALNADDTEKKAKARDFMIWGIIGLTVMIGVWGLVKVLGATFGLTNTSVLPQVRPN